MNKGWLKLALISIFAGLILNLPSSNYFSPIHKLERFYITYENETIRLEYDRLITNSESVVQDSLELIAGQDYVIDYTTGSITFFRVAGEVQVEYRIIPRELLQRYYLYEPVAFSDSTRIRIPLRRERSDYGQARLHISGSKTISISVGSVENLSLDQSLFLQIEGQLSSDLRVEAQLSDSQSPITPEGDSRELSSLDQVFLRFYGNKYELAFGDLEMEISRSRFFAYTPRFEGLKAGWSGVNQFQGALAIGGGKRTTLDLNGVEAKQGPYYLSTGTSYGLQVVPGSEEVFLNGELQYRGDDYTIDYSEGSITFSDRHFLTSSSRIRITFQYADEDFRQYLYLLNSSVNFTDKLSMGSRIILQNDDRSNPLLGSFSAEELEVLQQAGDSTAWASGVYPVAEGEGDYAFDEENDYYFYVGNDSTLTGNYDLFFSYVGPDQGLYDYNPEGGFYYYTGSGGSYLPVRKLSKPQMKANYGLDLHYRRETWQLLAEGIITDEDRNTFSGKNDDDNEALGGFLSYSFHPDWDKLEPEFNFTLQKQTSNLQIFSPLQSPRDAYDFQSIPDTLEQTQIGSELNFTVADIWNPGLRWRWNQADTFGEQHYLSFTSALKQKQGWPRLFYQFYHARQDIDREYQPTLPEQQISQHQLRSQYELGKFYTGIELLRNIEYLDFYSTDTRTGKQRNYLRYHLGYKNDPSLNSEIYLEYENSDTLTASTDWMREQSSQTAGLITNFTSANHRVKMNFAHRITDNGSKEHYDMGRFNMHNYWWKRAVALNTNYELRNVEFYPKVRELQYVGQELGVYDSLGFATENGEYDYVVTSIDYDNPRLSVELQASFNLKLNPAAATSSWLHRFQTESFLLVTENSTASRKLQLYLLNPDYLQNEDYTLYGRTDFIQNIWWDIISRKLSLLYTYEKDRSVDQRYNNQLESRLLESHELTMKLLSAGPANLELRAEKRMERESRFKLNSEINSLGSDLQYRVDDNLTLSTGIIFSREEGSEFAPENDYRLNSLTFSENVTYFLGVRYRFNARFSLRNNRREGSMATSYSDRLDGDILKWNLNANYRLNRYTYAFLEYRGENYPGRDSLHQLKLEIRAEF